MMPTTGRAMGVLLARCTLPCKTRYSAKRNNETSLCAQVPVRWRGFAQTRSRLAHCLPLRCARRHRALQWRTSSQTFAHLRRHTIGRPQVAQVLTGRSGLRRARGMSEIEAQLPGVAVAAARALAAGVFLDDARRRGIAAMRAPAGIDRLLRRLRRRHRIDHRRGVSPTEKST